MCSAGWCKLDSCTVCSMPLWEVLGQDHLLSFVSFHHTLMALRFAWPSRLQCSDSTMSCTVLRSSEPSLIALTVVTTRKIWQFEYIPRFITTGRNIHLSKSTDWELHNTVYAFVEMCFPKSDFDTMCLWTYSIYHQVHIFSVYPKQHTSSVQCRNVTAPHTNTSIMFLPETQGHERTSSAQSITPTTTRSQTYCLYSPWHLLYFYLCLFGGISPTPTFLLGHQ